MKVLVCSFLALALLSAACGSEANEGAGTGSAGPGDSPAMDAFPVSVKAVNGTVRLEKRPERIVSLSPTATEVLFAIGAGDQVEAVDDFSNYPAEAPTSNLSGLEPNVEAIAGYRPDLVVLSDDLGDVVKSLEAIEVPVIQQPAAEDLDDSYAQIEQLGALTGHVGDAAEVVSSMQSDIDQIVASLPGLESSPTYYHELDNTYFTATSETFIGRVYGLLGLTNIADEAPKAGAGYVQLSQEYIISADPDLIFLADTKCCGQSIETLAERPGWDGMSAVESGSVIELDDDIASRWGPRVVDYLRTVARSVRELESATS